MSEEKGREPHPIPMSLYVSAGRNHWEREQAIEYSTAKFLHRGKRRLRDKTFKAIENFEKSNWAILGLQPALAPRKSQTSGTGAGRMTISGDTSKGENVKASEPENPNRLVKRPATPLEMYDYGAINLRSISTDAINPHIRKEIRCTESFCSAPFGGYPVTMQEPIFMKPRNPGQPTVPYEGLVDAPPLKQCLSMSSLVGKLYQPSGVRCTRAHNRRAEAYLTGLANATMEEQLEEQKSWDGRHGFGWHDRCRDHLQWLDKNGRKDAAAWLREPSETWTDPQHLTFCVLNAMYAFIKARRMRARDLFKVLDENGSGVLEPNEFLAGLQRVRVDMSETLTLPDLVTVFRTVDDNFDGSIGLLELEKAMARIGRLRASMDMSTTGFSWMSSNSTRSTRRSATRG
eukprot:gnl/MRDRNA2_/MRDRNA2_75780_c0_seq1.p1 gnl/MRDRNA2_/MRDRNA2_75780_c0~~gnl/MRDRNA2_/MRDRNA2_75780_c0_seq1.p1  ORF type:complete len:402 (-),score=52.06 gnl/MRDRNA2_/MRDRNA2_75780_c0_seq1:8-1213(-)